MLTLINLFIGGGLIAYSLIFWGLKTSPITLIKQVFDDSPAMYESAFSQGLFFAIAFLIWPISLLLFILRRLKKRE